jgi:hypothetical protein
MSRTFTGVTTANVRVVGVRDADAGNPRRTVFLFFSNRLGCFGSLVVSAVATLILLLILGVINLGH